MINKDKAPRTGAKSPGIEMKNDVRLVCDRCGVQFPGTYTTIGDEVFSTEGFLHATSPFWEQFTAENEVVLCSGCVEADEDLFRFCSNGHAGDGAQ